VVANKLPVRAEIYSKEPGKKEDWFRDTSDSGEVTLVNHACVGGQVFQARPKLPGFLFNEQQWKPCQPGVIPFEFKRVLYSNLIRQIVTLTAALQPTDDQTKVLREVFLKSYESGHFFALSAASAEMRKKFLAVGEKDKADLFNTMTLESFQRGLGSGRALILNPQNGKYELPEDVVSKFAKDSNTTISATQIETSTIKNVAAEYKKTMSIPDAVLMGQ
jgi:hypothetical protein